MWRCASRRLVPLLHNGARALPSTGVQRKAYEHCPWLASLAYQTHPRFDRCFSAEAPKPEVKIVVLDDEVTEVDDLGIATGQELLAEKEGKKLFDLDPPRGPFRTKLFAASSLGQMQYYGFTPVRFYANAQAVNVKELDCSPELKDLHEKFTTEVQGKRTVPRALLHNILEQCNSTEDVDLAFRILQDYRVYRSSKARVKQNFNQNISTLAVSASLRSRSYGLGLKALWKHNVFGLSPTIENAHMFLSHARKEKDIDLMKKTLRTMLKNLVMPTAQTAEIVIRICKDNGDLNLMFNLADEFIQNGVMLSSSVFDILIATAANFGFVEKVFEAQKLREEAGLDHTMASAFAIAKAHLLQGEPQIGVDLIAKHCKDNAKVKKYLAMLVRAWPSELLSRKEQTQIEGDDHFTGLKDNVILFAKALSKEFRGVSIDAEQEFGKDQRNPNKDNGADEKAESS